MTWSGAADRVERDLGGADVLVNNADVMLLGPFDCSVLASDRRRTDRSVQLDLLQWRLHARLDVLWCLLARR
jgi:hypothetical protein